MGKNEKDILPIPGDGGIWAVKVVTGETFKGTIIGRHDNAMEIMTKDDKGKNVAMNIINDKVVYCWTEIEDEVQEA